MVILGLLLVLVAIAVAAIIIIGTNNPDVAAQAVDIDLLNVTIRLTPLELLLTGMGVMFVFWLGLVIMREALARKARARRERKDAETEARSRQEELQRKAEEEREAAEAERQAAERERAAAEEEARRLREERAAAGVGAGAAVAGGAAAGRHHDERHDVDHRADEAVVDDTHRGHDRDLHREADVDRTQHVQTRDGDAQPVRQHEAEDNRFAPPARDHRDDPQSAEHREYADDRTDVIREDGHHDPEREYRDDPNLRQGHPDESHPDPDTLRHRDDRGPVNPDAPHDQVRYDQDGNPIDESRLDPDAPHEHRDNPPRT